MIIVIECPESICHYKWYRTPTITKIFVNTLYNYNKQTVIIQIRFWTKKYTTIERFTRMLASIVLNTSTQKLQILFFNRVLIVHFFFSPIKKKTFTPNFYLLCIIIWMLFPSLDSPTSYLYALLCLSPGRPSATFRIYQYSFVLKTTFCFATFTCLNNI